MRQLLYGISDKPKTIKEWVMYSMQQVLAVFVQTVLIANICGTPVDQCLFGACIGTLLYQLVTKFKSPMFISSCGATCSAVIGALATSKNEFGVKNYLAVAVGGFVIFLVYSIFSVISKKFGIQSINKIFPPVIVGQVTIVIGANLATFIPTYTQIGGQHSNIGILIAVFTMLTIQVSSHYFNGFLKTIPFLIGLAFGYIVSSIITLTTGIKVIDFQVFSNINSIISVPDFAFLHFGDTPMLSFKEILSVVIMFLPVAICALLEHYSDHKVLSNIIGTDLTKEPGLHRTLFGDGLASFVGTVLCGLPNTSYGESIATTGFSKVQSTQVLSVQSCILGALSFITPVQVFINSIPSCVFGGCQMILYGYIQMSGVKTLLNNNIDFEDNKNLIIVSVILTVGVSGIWLFDQSFTGVALAMVLGVVLNLILRMSNKS